MIISVLFFEVLFLSHICLVFVVSRSHTCFQAAQDGTLFCACLIIPLFEVRVRLILLVSAVLASGTVGFLSL